MEPEALLHDLDESQRRAVTSPARPVAILAPAGSGKTRVLTRRIAWRVATGEADSRRVLALTFTRKAAGELRDRLGRLGLRDGVAAGTFHAVAFAQIRRRWADRGERPPVLLARKARLLAELLRETESKVLSPAQLAGEIEWAKARLLGPHDYPAGTAEARRRTPAPPQAISELYTRYEDAKRQRRLVDFDDLLRLCSHLIETDEAFAAAQRWLFRHLFVDEFQDVNPLQLRLLDAWRGTSYDLCVVGDADQAIYGWNGADVGFLEGFRIRFPSAEVVDLTHNYRSTPQVLDAAAAILRAGGVGGRAVRAVRPEGLVPTVEHHETDREEAQAIARATRDRHAPRAPWSAQAVLVRTHAQIALIAEAFRAARVPYRIRGAHALLERPEVRAALDLLRSSKGSLSACLPDVAALGEDGGHDDEAVANIDLLVQLARDHLGLDPSASAPAFAGWLAATLQAEGTDHRTDAVTLATFHAAKGLEWPIVHLAGLEDGLSPITHARTAADRAEEARLLYVAMTRAEDELHCHWAAHRSFGDRVLERRRCPWLSALPWSTGPDPRDGSEESVANWRSRIAEQRVQLAAAHPPSPALAALRRWREHAARAARVEPATLADDRLLESVASAMPATADELAAVPGMGPLLAARVGEGMLAALHRDEPSPVDDQHPL